jgi:lysylphosphatidylglycerol synthetase-like protein (DUF2156 family)
MLGSRLLNMFLRACQAFSAAVVIALAGWFEYQYRNTDSDVDPHWRIIYTLVISCIAFLAALVLFIPFTVSVINYFWDFIMMVLWFVAFGLLLDWFGDPDCNNDKSCKRWKTIEAFSFISAILWGGSMILALILVHHIRQGFIFTDQPVMSRPYRYRSRV